MLSIFDEPTNTKLYHYWHPEQELNLFTGFFWISLLASDHYAAGSPVFIFICSTYQNLSNLYGQYPVARLNQRVEHISSSEFVQEKVLPWLTYNTLH